MEVSDEIGYAKFRSRSHSAVIRVYDDAGNVIGSAMSFFSASTISIRPRVS